MRRQPLLLLLLYALDATAGGGGAVNLPAHSWERVPTYAFCAPAAHAWNDTELSWLGGTAAAGRFAPPPVWLAMGYVAGSAMPPVGENSEAKQAAMAKQLRAKVPNLPIWFGTAWGVFAKMFKVGDYFKQHPELLLHCNGSLVAGGVGSVKSGIMDWSNPQTRTLWSNFFAAFMASGPFTGVLIDGIGPLLPPYDATKSGYDIYQNPACSAATKSSWVDGLSTVSGMVRAAIGRGNMTMCNGHDQLFTTSRVAATASSSSGGGGGGGGGGLASSERLSATPRPASGGDDDGSNMWCSGNFEEEWAGRPADVVLQLRAGQIPDYVFAVRSVYSGYRADFARSLAAFLVAATENHYFLHFSQYDCGQQPGSQMAYYREYTLPLGPPTASPGVPDWGGCDFDGCFLTREYSKGARVLYNATRGELNTCVLWPDGTETEYGRGCEQLKRLPPH